MEDVSAFIITLARCFRYKYFMLFQFCGKSFCEQQQFNDLCMPTAHHIQKLIQVHHFWICFNELIMFDSVSDLLAYLKLNESKIYYYYLCVYIHTVYRRILGPLQQQMQFNNNTSRECVFSGLKSTSYYFFYLL